MAEPGKVAVASGAIDDEKIVSSRQAFNGRIEFGFFGGVRQCNGIRRRSGNHLMVRHDKIDVCRLRPGLSVFDIPRKRPLPTVQIDGTDPKSRVKQMRNEVHGGGRLS